MEIKIVKRPLQDQYTKPEEIQYPNEHWCVETQMFREGDGGIKCWFDYLKKMEEKGCTVVYLYDIKATKEKIVNGSNENDWFEDIFYFVRADYKC